MNWLQPAREVLGAASAILLLGGGASLLDAPSGLLRARSAIACNDSYYLLQAPCVVVGMDARWIEWHRDRLLLRGDVVITRANHAPVASFHYVRTCNLVLSDNPAALAGKDTGYAAVNAAALLGFKQIILAGYDMKFRGGKTHWHAGHPIPSFDQNYALRFAPTYLALIQQLEVAGVEVLGLPGCGVPVKPVSYGSAADMLEVAL